MKTKFRFLLPLSVVMGVLLILTTCCDVSDPEPTCTDGIQNGLETDVDCGGDCPPCFVCLTNYCSLLTGATSGESRSNIKWTSILAEGTPHVDEWKFNFYSTGTVFENDEGVTGNGTWVFDDPTDPTEIIITYKDPPAGWPNPFTCTLLHLSQDTLKLHDGYWKWTFIKE